MGLLSRIFTPRQATRSVPVEGEYRPGSYALMEGWLPSSWGQYINWWQMGYDPLPPTRLAIVEACVSAYAQTIAMCPGDHWHRAENGGHERVKTSALSRILRRPNSYQTTSDFLLNLVRSLYLDGNAYALGLRNDRFEISELHLMNARESGARLAETGDIFYHLGGNEVIERQLAAFGPEFNALNFVPARDVLHVKLHTPRHPLRGETPLEAAMLDVVSAGAMAGQSYAFASNQSRPSGILSTDQILTAEQVDILRKKWNEHSQGLNAGGVPILSAGLKFQQMSMSAKDAQIIEQMKLTEQHIALVFRMPLQILGMGEGAPYASTEALMSAWIASGLGFVLNHVEEGFGKMFGLSGYPSDYCSFDTSALLRSNFAERMQGLNAAVQGGIYAPNEARDLEGLPKAQDGDEPRVQRQVIPLSAWDKPVPTAVAPKPPPSPIDAGDPDGDEGEPGEPARSLRELVAEKRRYGRLAA